MKQEINHHDSYSLATIVPKKLQTVSAYITVDTHTESSPILQAIHKVYTDAIISGTKKLSREEFLGAINLLGASIVVSTQAGRVTISLKSQKTNFNKVLKLLEDMLAEPAFSSKELSRIHSTVLNELHEAKEDARTVAHQNLCNTIYGNKDREYVYPLDKIGSELKKVTPASLKKYHSDVMSGFWTCSIGGEKQTCLDFEKLIKKLKTTNQHKVHNAKHNQKSAQPKAVLTNIPSRTNIEFSLGAPLPFTLHHPDYIPLQFGLNVLAKWGGFSGRLMSTVREKEGLTYGIYGQLTGFSSNEQGYWRIMTFFAPQKSLQGLTSTFREITKIYQKGITDDELKRFKTITLTQDALVKDSIGGQLSQLHTFHSHGFTLDEIELWKKRTEKLTRKEVNEVIKKYLNPKTLTVSGAGPINPVKKDLQKFIKTVQ